MKKIGVLLTALAMVFMSCEQPLSEDYLREVISGMMTEENGGSEPIEITWEKVDYFGIIPTKKDGYYSFFMNYFYYDNNWAFIRNDAIEYKLDEYRNLGQDYYYQKRYEFYKESFMEGDVGAYINAYESVWIDTGIVWKTSKPCYLQFIALNEKLKVSNIVIGNGERIIIEVTNKTSERYEIYYGDEIAKGFVLSSVPTTAKVKE